MRDARILAMDPGFTKGVKCVALDENGVVLTRFHCDLKNEEAMKDYITSCVKKMALNKIVIGNGTASRQVADITANVIEERKLSVEYAIVSEAGASVYSVSDVAKEEFPNLDPIYRGAVSIGRRVIDPLSELVKIPVRSMGIGMYQHDISEAELTRALNRVVESCVTCVGVNAAVANRYVMEKIPGVTKRMVDQIVLARRTKKLLSREDLRRIPGMTEAVYKQIAGFFRFPNSPNPLDNSNIHPESYPIVEKLMGALNEEQRVRVGRTLQGMGEAELKELADRVGCGRATLELLAVELASPALDPRSELPYVGLFRRASKKADVKAGDKLSGVVQSVTTFGAFVDVGLHDDILVRNIDIDAVHVGSVLNDILVSGVDELGRIQAKHNGGANHNGGSQSRGLTIESEEILTSPTELGGTQMLSSSLAEVREERQRLFQPTPPQGEGDQLGHSRSTAHTSGKEVKRQRKREREERRVKEAAAVVIEITEGGRDTICPRKRHRRDADKVTEEARPATAVSKGSTTDSNAVTDACAGDLPGSRGGTKEDEMQHAVRSALNGGRRSPRGSESGNKTEEPLKEPRTRPEASAKVFVF
ncbi:unnamed protein product [Trypanosoma congolense IL3000]|uniref:WGS project CAEQ00000000 data, annotated contig 1063 n=1 Tax=Trypanosoma congolense (strain IL3000) TaxID=1068625 RepID=F9W3J8_TRYCI|nr:unnamed protein product [Trypanosoma congolense IL3000]